MTIRLYVPDARSLKDKRQSVRSLTDRLKRFNVSVAETDLNDTWRSAVVSVAAVAATAAQARRRLEEAERAAVELLGPEIADAVIEQL